jgi:hypothetical protein
MLNHKCLKWKIPKVAISPPLELSLSGVFSFIVKATSSPRSGVTGVTEASQVLENQQVNAVTPPVTAAVTPVAARQRWGNKWPETVTLG